MDSTDEPDMTCHQVWEFIANFSSVSFVCSAGHVNESYSICMSNVPTSWALFPYKLHEPHMFPRSPPYLQLMQALGFAVLSTTQIPTGDSASRGNAVTSDCVCLRAKHVGITVNKHIFHKLTLLLVSPPTGASKRLWDRPGRSHPSSELRIEFGKPQSLDNEETHI